MCSERRSKGLHNACSCHHCLAGSFLTRYDTLVRADPTERSRSWEMFCPTQMRHFQCDVTNVRSSGIPSVFYETSDVVAMSNDITQCRKPSICYWWKTILETFF